MTTEIQTSKGAVRFYSVSGPIAEIPAQYRKVRFTSKQGETAGLVIQADKLAKMSMQDVSRLFPYSESRFMCRIEQSPAFSSWDEAFAYDFPISR